MKRKCSICKEVKTGRSFYKSNTYPSGYGYICKKCSKIDYKKRCRANKLKHKGNYKNYTKQKCYRCKQIKELEGGFYKNSCDNNGYNRICIKCF
jgi:hypothetical protein